MKEYKVYVCEKCGQEFTQGFPEGYDKCQEHEKGHVEPDVYGIRNNGSYQSGDKYPTYITIPMADGAEVVYEKAAIKKEAEKEVSPLLSVESTLDTDLKRFRELREKKESEFEQKESPRGNEDSQE